MAGEWSRRVQAGIVLFTAPHLALLAWWGATRWQRGEIEAGAWSAYRHAGEAVHRADWAGAYADPAWTAPPTSALLYHPLALAPADQAWLAWTAVQLGALLFALLRLRALWGGDWRLWGTIATVALSSVAFADQVRTGGNAGLVLLLFAGVTALLARQRPVAAGTLLGFVVIEPRWLPAALVIALLADGPVLHGFVLTAALLLGASWADGGEAWRAFLDLGLVVEPGATSVLGTLGASTTDPRWLAAGWCAAAVVALVAVWAQWQLPARDAFAHGRRVSAALLATVALSPALAGHDAVVLVLAGACWAAHRAAWSDDGRWAAVGVFVAAAWLWDALAGAVGLLVAVPLPASIVGPVALGWLVLDALDARAEQHRTAATLSSRLARSHVADPRATR